MKRILCTLVLAASSIVPAVKAGAADIHVLTMAPFQPVLEQVLPGWEKSTGNHAVIVIDTPSKEEKRIAAGETYDLVLSNEDSAGRLAQSGKYISFTPVAVAGMSIAVRTGGPKPDISTVAAFKAAMLNAKSVATTEPGPFGSSGYVTMEVFDRLGITSEMKPKLVIIVPPVTAADPVADGKAEIGLQQTSEMIGRSDVTIVGPFPPELQHSTTYVVGLNASAPESARSLQALMAGPQARALLADKGLSAP